MQKILIALHTSKTFVLFLKTDAITVAQTQKEKKTFLQIFLGNILKCFKLWVSEKVFFFSMCLNVLSVQNSS